MTKLDTAHTVYKPWGKEVWLELNDKYCYKRIYINAGTKTSYQYHERKLETNFIIEGTAEIWLEDDKVLRTPISNHHSNNIYFVTLKNSSNQFVGMIGLVLEEEFQLERESYIFIREKVGSIGTLLTDYLNGK